MGTRLYPQTSDTSVIERLINVPKGTYARLEQLRIAFDAAFKPTESCEISYTQNPDHKGEDVGYLFHQLINADLNLSKLSSFLTFGWGKFEQREGDDCIGDIDSGIDAQHMLVSATNGEYFSNHMSPKEAVELANGLCWS